MDDVEDPRAHRVELEMEVGSVKLACLAVCLVEDILLVDAEGGGLAAL